MFVAPYVGAWIETVNLSFTPVLEKSHPTWVRGLKPQGYATQAGSVGRTLRGCVD